MEKDSQTDSKQKSYIHFNVFVFSFFFAKYQSKAAMNTQPTSRASRLVSISMVCWLTGSGWSLCSSLTQKQKFWHCPQWGRNTAVSHIHLQTAILECNLTTSSFSCFQNSVAFPITSFCPTITVAWKAQPKVTSLLLMSLCLCTQLYCQVSCEEIIECACLNSSLSHNSESF